jgi:hypothetical protein
MALTVVAGLEPRCEAELTMENKFTRGGVNNQSTHLSEFSFPTDSLLHYHRPSYDLLDDLKIQLCKYQQSTAVRNPTTNQQSESSVKGNAS